MKKIIVLLMVLLTMCSSVLAKDKTTKDEKPKLTKEEQRVLAEAFAAMADSKLDLKRWTIIDGGDNGSFYVFIDEETVTAPYSDVLEVWVCYFFPAGKGGCGAKLCKEKKINTAKHYHYFRDSFDLLHLKSKCKSWVIRDESMKVVDSLDVPSYLQTESNVFPGSLGEAIMLRAKEIASQKKKKR